MTRPPPSNDLHLRPIGHVRASWARCDDVPVQGGPAEIVIAPEFAAGLDGVERSTHLIVFGWLDRADRSVLRARPRKVAPKAPPCGVFACRAPVRPNPLAFTVVELLAREGLVLHVDPLDLADATPIVDIKGYSPGWDTVFAARRDQRVPARELADTHLRAFLQRDVRNYVGSACRRPEVQRVVDAVFAAIRHFGLSARDPSLSVVVGALDLRTDALAAMLGASFGSGRLRLDPAMGEHQVSFRRGEERFDVALAIEE